MVYRSSASFWDDPKAEDISLDSLELWVDSSDLSSMDMYLLPLKGVVCLVRRIIENRDNATSDLFPKLFWSELLTNLGRAESCFVDSKLFIYPLGREYEMIEQVRANPTEFRHLNLAKEWEVLVQRNFEPADQCLQLYQRWASDTDGFNHHKSDDYWFDVLTDLEWNGRLIQVEGRNQKRGFSQWTLNQGGIPSLPSQIPAWFAFFSAHAAIQTFGLLAIDLQCGLSDLDDDYIEHRDHIFSYSLDISRALSRWAYWYDQYCHTEEIEYQEESWIDRVSKLHAGALVEIPEPHYRDSALLAMKEWFIEHARVPMIDRSSQSMRQLYRFYWQARKETKYPTDQDISEFFAPIIEFHEYSENIKGNERNREENAKKYRLYMSPTTTYDNIVAQEYFENRVPYFLKENVYNLDLVDLFNGNFSGEVTEEVSKRLVAAFVGIGENSFSNTFFRARKNADRRLTEIRDRKALREKRKNEIKEDIREKLGRS